LGSNGAKDGTNKASEDVVGFDGSGLVYRSTALNGTAIAATIDGAGHRRGGEGGGDEESNFGEHRE